MMSKAQKDDMFKSSSQTDDRPIDCIDERGRGKTDDNLSTPSNEIEAANFLNPLESMSKEV
jgi:hypothetical protein